MYDDSTTIEDAKHSARAALKYRLPLPHLTHLTHNTTSTAV